LSTSKIEVLSADAPVLRFSDGSYRLIGPLTQDIVDARVVRGVLRATDVNEVPFALPLDRITGLRATPDPTLKGMAGTATAGATLIGQAVPDNAPNAQYTLAMLQANIDAVSFANADKLSSVARLTSGLMTAAQFDFSTGNAARDRLGIPQRQLHGCMYWHNGNPSGWAPGAANVKDQIDIINAAYKKNWDDKGYTAALRYMDVVNEIVDNATSDYVKVSPLTTAFRNSSAWATEIQPFGITTDPGAFGWLYFVRKAAETWGAGVKLAIGDFGISENTTQYGFGANLDGWFGGTAHQPQRQERFFFNVRTGMKAQAAGYPGRLDAVNFQTHLSPGRMLVPSDLRWRNYEANVLGLGVVLGEINLLLDNAEDAAIMAALGIARGTPEEFLYHINYIATHLAICMASCANLNMIQPWTDVTDFANGAKTTFTSTGAPDAVYRAIQKVMQVNPTKRAIRAARVLFAKSLGFRPYEIEGSAFVNNSSGLRGTGVKMPWSRFLRRDLADGVVKPFSSSKWEQTCIFVRSGANAAVANGRPLYFEDSSGNVVLAFSFNSNADIVMTTSAGSVVLTPTTLNGDHFRIGVQYQNGTLKACLARRSSSGVFVPAGPIVSQVVNLPTIAKVGYVDGTSTSTVLEHRVYDEASVSATDADFQARSGIPTDYGAPLRALAIYDGSAMLAA